MTDVIDDGQAAGGLPIAPVCAAWASPEFQLAALCCRHPWKGQDTDELRHQLRRVDPERFADLVIRRHRIGPLAWAMVNRLPPGDVPATLRQALASEVRANAVRVLRSQRAHVLLARALHAAGMPWMVFKGVTLSARCYGDAAARHANDIDLWTTAAHLHQARDLLAGLGFKAAGEAVPWHLASLGPRHAAFVDRYFIEEVFDSRELGVLELHWRLAVNTHQFSIDPIAIHARGSTQHMGAVDIPVMGDVDLLLYLCEHGARHRWSRLKWLADLPRLLHGREWDWPEVFRRARDAGCVKSLALGLELSRRVLGCELPAPAAAWLAGRPMSSLALRLAVSLTRRMQEGPEVVENTAGSQMVLLGQEVLNAVVLAGSPRAVAYQVRRALLSSRDMTLLRLPDRLFFLYYPLRPLLMPFRRALLRRAAPPAGC